MRVLVACEESQRVCIAFREKGHEAYSCDIIECSGGHPEWHIKGDCLPLLNGYKKFQTQDGKWHIIPKKWDMIIAHPPCTRLCNSGQRWLYWGDKEYQEKKKKEQEKAIAFFMRFTNTNCDKIAIENPCGIMSSIYRKPDQIYNPYDFQGETECKKTCLWLKNLQPLEETENVYTYMMTLSKKERNRILWMGSGHAKERSKTYPGIARAMAEQWAGPVEAVLKGGDG